MAMAMAMPMAMETIGRVETSSERLRLNDVNPDAIKFFVEKILYKIYKHFDEQQLIDVTFKLSNPAARVTAHRLILSSASPYFSDLFRSDRGICPLIEITDIDSDTFERLITFCYTGKTLITMDNVDKMLKAALTLQLDDAVANCVNFLIENINDYTLQRVYSLNDDVQCEKLQEKILEYEIKNFTKIVESDQFLNYDSNKLQAILQSDDLNVKCEKDVFEVVKRWYEHDTSLRKEELPNLISCLRLTQFDVDFLMANIHPLPGCKLLTLETLAWVNFPTTRGNISLKYPKPRNGQSGSHGFIFSTGLSLPLCSNPTTTTSGHSENISSVSYMTLKISSGSSKLKTIFQYNKTADLWQKWRDIEVDIDKAGVIFYGENLIVAGGYRNHVPTNEVFSWNFKSGAINSLPAMLEKRQSHSMVVLHNIIYAIGGCISNAMPFPPLQTVETYCALSGWVRISPMKIARQGAAAVGLDDKIYVIGGVNCGVTLKSVECYNPTTRLWTQCADMNEPHECPSATVHKGQIFVVGGKNSTTVERYDPQKNSWTKICSLSIERCGVSCISIDNKLWAIGGQPKNNPSNAQASDLFSFSIKSNDPVIKLPFGYISRPNVPLVEPIFGKTNQSSDPPNIFGQSNTANTFSFSASDDGLVSIYDEENDKWIDKSKPHSERSIAGA